MMPRRVLGFPVLESLSSTRRQNSVLRPEREQVHYQVEEHTLGIFTVWLRTATLTARSDGDDQ
jgi:hypothetical protein